MVVPAPPPPPLPCPDGLLVFIACWVCGVFCCRMEALVLLLGTAEACMSVAYKHLRGNQSQLITRNLIINDKQEINYN